MIEWNGLEPPDALDLLETARRAVLEGVAPVASGDARFKALMAANAIAIAVRAIRIGPEEAADALAALTAASGAEPAKLCHDIREGRYDPGTARHEAVAAALLALAEARCRVSAPKSLT
jgi:hypothetical protein